LMRDGKPYRVRVQRAAKKLEADGLIHTPRRMGTHVERRKRAKRIGAWRSEVNTQCSKLFARTKNPWEMQRTCVREHVHDQIACGGRLGPTLGERTSCFIHGVNMFTRAKIRIDSQRWCLLFP
jgi:hypothetical protein